MKSTLSKLHFILILTLQNEESKLFLQYTNTTLPSIPLDKSKKQNEKLKRFYYYFINNTTWHISLEKIKVKNFKNWKINFTNKFYHLTKLRCVWVVMYEIVRSLVRLWDHRVVGSHRWSAFLVGSGWCFALLSLWGGRAFCWQYIRVQSILGFRASWNSLCEQETGRSGAKRSHVASQLVACESIATLLPHHQPPDPALQVRCFFFGPLSKTLLSSVFTLKSDDLFGPNLWSCCSWVQSRTKRDLNVLFAQKKLQRCCCHSSPLQDVFLHPLLVFCPKDMN